MLQECGANDSHGSAPPKLVESDRSEAEELPTFGGAAIGDLVQWKLSGALRFEKPQRVRAVSDDGAYVAVEGSETGIPMNEVIVEERAPARADRVAPSFAPVGTTTQASPAMEGEMESIRNKLGKSTDVRLLVKGDMGPREIGHLIRLLEAQKAARRRAPIFRDRALTPVELCVPNGRRENIAQAFSLLKR